MSDTLQPIFEVLPEDMANPDYSILVYPYAFGQYRIQLTKVTIPDNYAPEGHGDIRREMCTYQPKTLHRTLSGLRQAEDPYAYTQELAEPYNCEYQGGRIRLDNTPDDKLTNANK